MEREWRGWSTATVAEKMAEAGHPLNQSAVWRIESGDPPRRVNLDEAIGFAKIFDITLDSLIGPPEVAADAHLAGLLKTFIGHWEEWIHAQDEMNSARAALDTYMDAHPHQRELVQAMITRDLARAAGDRYRSPSFPAGGLTDAQMEEIKRRLQAPWGQRADPIHADPPEPTEGSD